jgi:cytochrome c oxidase assembly protein Cox11
VFGVSYLMVPLYRIFCAMTGIQGDVQVKNQTLLDEIEKKRAEGRFQSCHFFVYVSA